MNRTIIININGIVFHIEEDAYEVLRSYMIAVKQHFGHTPDSHEIVGDIENRIAEMFNERIEQGRKEVITMQDVNEVTAQMGSVDDFQNQESEADFGETFQGSSGAIRRKLMRDPDDKVLGGVCSGLGHYFEIDAKWVRLALVLLILLAGTGFLLYLVLWVVIPKAETRADRMAMRGEAPNLQNFKRSFKEEMDGVRSNFPGVGRDIRNGLETAGDILIKLGVLLAKLVAVLLVLAACFGLIVLLISISASFGFLGRHNNMAMFPFIVIEPVFRTPLLISALLLAIIPFVALIALVIRILFNRSVMNKYFGFTLLAAWILALGFTAVCAGRTWSDFREKSTIVQERTLEKRPVYFLSRNDITVIKLSGDAQDRRASILQGAKGRNRNFLEGQNRMYMHIVRVDSLQQPAVRYEFSARGANYERAAERAGQIDYQLHQAGDTLSFDNHFSLNENQLMRDQNVHLTLLIPVGTLLNIDRDLKHHIWDLPFNQCEENYAASGQGQPEYTQWIMTPSGLKCVWEAPEPPAEEQPADSLVQQPGV